MLNSSHLNLHAITKSSSRAPLACLPCRDRHSRCDGTRPICTRCKSDGKICNYAKSRRGGLDRAALARRRMAAKKIPDQQLQHQNRRPNSCVGRQNEHPQAAVTLNEWHLDTILPFDASDKLTSWMSTTRPRQSQLLDAYYNSFHGAHPFVLPYKFFKAQLATSSSAVRQLSLVMQYVGSFYCPSIASLDLRSSVQVSLADLVESGPFEVQSLMLFASALHWNDEWELARQTLDNAIEKALDIGMNLKEFATRRGEAIPVLEESWRRTWWMLFATDANFAVVRQATTFLLRDVEATVDLPCEEAAYQSGIIPPPRTLQELDCREFAIDDADFSSFAHFVDAVRNFGSTLVVEGKQKDAHLACENTDALWTGWALLIPKSKREFVGQDGKVDEMLLHAYMGMLAATIYSHRPLSRLSYNAIEAVSRCAPPPPPEKMSVAFQEASNFHTAKVLEAIEKQVKLLTLPGSFTLRCPNLICMLAVSIIAHLSACSFVLNGDALSIARSQIRASIGALQSWEDIWPLGKRTLREIKAIAREVLFSTPSENAVVDPNPADLFMNETTSFVDPFAWTGQSENVGDAGMIWDIESAGMV